MCVMCVVCQGTPQNVQNLFKTKDLKLITVEQTADIRLLFILPNRIKESADLLGIQNCG